MAQAKKEKEDINKKVETSFGEVKEKSDKRKEDPKPEEPKRKSQKVKVLVSVYRYGDKIISAHGIPKNDAWLSHIIDKNKLKADEMFNIISALKNDDTYRKDAAYSEIVSKMLDSDRMIVNLPEKKANTLKAIGNLIHEILNVEIELFLK